MRHKSAHFEEVVPLLLNYQQSFVDNLAKEGQLLQNGQICASLVSLSPLKIVGNVSELVVSKIKPGQPVKIKLISGEEFETAVTFVASTADSQTRTFRVESELPNEQSFAHWVIQTQL